MNLWAPSNFVGHGCSDASDWSTHRVWAGVGGSVQSTTEACRQPRHNPGLVWHRRKAYYMEYIVHGSKNQIDNSFFTYFGAISLKWMRRFDLLTTDLGHALVVCDLVKSQTTNAWPLKKYRSKGSEKTTISKKYWLSCVALGGRGVIS